MRRIRSILLVFVAAFAMIFAGCDMEGAVEYIADNIEIEDYDESFDELNDAVIENVIDDSADILKDNDFAFDSSDDNTESEVIKEDEEFIDEKDEKNSSDGELSVTEDGEYSGKEEVALYIHKYGHLPSNYITKKEAENLGWNSSEGNLWKVAYGKSIGGDKFGNREGNLPKADGRQYYECDIDFDGGFRNAKRIVYSNDGLVYYTEDHYNTFEKLY